VNLGSRLSALAAEVTGKSVLDIGSDHGKLPAALVSSGKCSRAAATDINAEPLEAAKQTAKAAGVSHKIEFLLSDGVDKLDTADFTDIVIAGMGGETIAGILERGGEKIIGKNLILQAMSKSDLLFDFLSLGGFRFSKIARVIDDGRFYTYFVCRKSQAGTVTTKDIYSAFDVIAPFENAAQWDNSGVLTGRADKSAVTGVLCCTDITAEAVKEAEKCRANVIVSHHPVIGFDPLKKIPYAHPAAIAAAKGIVCICSHTPFDVSPYGMNRLFLKAFETAVCGVYDVSLLDKIADNIGFGVTFTLKTPMMTSEIAAKLKTALKTQTVRFSGDRIVKKAAFCSGSGSTYLEKIIDENLSDLYITGDIKQAGFTDAENAGLSLIDAGHWGTEHAFADFAREYLMSAFPELPVFVYDKEPFEVV
jgi:dinuclear metal center YbgI/SA1388 family protein